MLLSCLQLNSYYAAGRVMVPALLDTFTCQGFFKRRALLDLLTELAGELPAARCAAMCCTVACIGRVGGGRRVLTVLCMLASACARAGHGCYLQTNHCLRHLLRLSPVNSSNLNAVTHTMRCRFAVLG
jgi:hypothetical protein